MIHDEETLSVWVANLFASKLGYNETKAKSTLRTNVNDFFEPNGGYIVINVISLGSRDSTGRNYLIYDDEAEITKQYMRKIANFRIVAYGSAALADLQKFDFLLDGHFFNGDMSIEKEDVIDISNENIGTEVEKIGIFNGIIRYVDELTEVRDYAEVLIVSSVEDSDANVNFSLDLGE